VWTNFLNELASTVTSSRVQVGHLVVSQLVSQSLQAHVRSDISDGDLSIGDHRVACIPNGALDGAERGLAER
jgi:hypothetical protein